MKKFGVYRYIALIFTLLVVSTAVWGQTYWIGGPGPASATNPANWSAGVPGAGDTAIIDSDAQIEIPGSGTIGTAIVDAGNTVNFIIQAGTLTVSTQLQNNGNLTINGPGNLTVSGTTLNANTGTLTIGAGGARNLGPLTNNGTLVVGANTVTTGLISGGGLITVSTGTITATGTIANLETSGTATINLSGDITALTVVAGTPTLNGVVAGLTAGGNPGGAIITTGTVTLNGNTFTSITNSGTLSFTNAATLSGDINNTGALTFNNTAALSGDMNLTAGSLTLGGAVSVGGDWTDGGATLTHNNNAVNFTPTGTSTITGNTTFYDLNCVNQGGDTLSITNAITVTNNLTLTGTDALNRLTITGTGSIGLPGHQVSGEFLTVDPNIDIIGGGMYTAYNSTASGAVPTNWYITAGAPGEFVWTGATSSNWHTGSNWDTGFAPVNATDNVEIVNLGLPPTVSAPVGIDVLTITSGTLTLASSLQTNGNLVIGGAGVLDCAGQNLTVAGALNNNGTVHLTGAETLSIPVPANAAGSTVIYEGPGPTTPVWGNAYGNLTIETVSTWTATSGLTIAGTLSITGTASASFNTGAGGQITTAGTAIITSTGTISLGNAAGDQFNCTTGGFTSDAPTTLFGQLNANGQDITFNGSLTIQGASAVSTGGGTGNIEFNNVLEGIVGNTDTLTITAGAGSVLFDDTVGLGEELGSLTVSLASGGITANNTIDAQTVSLTGGTVVLGDTVTASGGFSSTGTDFSNGGTIATTGNNLTINHTGAITIGAGLSSGNGNISVGAVAAGTITLSDATPATTTDGNITFNRPVTLTVDAVISTGAGVGNIAFGANSSVSGAQALELLAGTGNIRFGTVDGQCPIGTAPLTSLTSLTVTSADDVTFYSTVNAGFVLQSDSGSTGTTTFWRDVTTTTTGIEITNNIINLRGLTMTATGDDITLTGAVTLSDAAVSLEATDDIGITGAVSGAQTLTINNANDVTFDDTVSIANLVQTTGSGTTTFIQNVTTSDANGIAIDTTNIVLDGLTMTAGTVATADIALTGAVTLSTADVVLQAEDAITVTGTVDSAVAQNRSLTATSTNNGAIGFTGLIGGTTPLASLTIDGGDISLNGIGDAGGSGVTGIIDVDSTGAVDLFADYYRSGDEQTWDAPNGGVRYRATADGTWNAGGAGIGCPGTDVYLDHDGQTLTLASALSCQNFYFYRGALNTTGGSITTTGDIVIFGAGYDPEDGEWAVGNTRHAYYHFTALSYYPGAASFTSPVVTFDLAALPNASFSAGTTLNVGQSFYINGADMTTGTFTLNLNANTGDNCTFNAADTVSASQWGIPYAVAFHMTANNVNTANGWVAASTNAQGVAIGGTTNNWQIARPVIRATRTIYDNVIHITFEDDLTSALMSIENSSGQITAAMTSVAALGNGGIWYDGGFAQFDGVYSDPECFTPLTVVSDVSEFYLHDSGGSWNTDATGISPGDADSTDRDGNLRGIAPNPIVPDLSFLKGLLSAAEGKTMISNYGAHGDPIYTGTTDRCRPVLVEVRTGQELHENVLGNQLPYDAHNFIELRYSEPVDIGGFAGAPPVGGITYAKAMTSFTNNTDWGGAISGSGPLTIAGYASIASGTLVTGTRGSHAAPAPAASDPTVHALYREFSLDGAVAPVNQPHRLRISIAGWCEPLAPSFFWQGFITSAVTPSGAVTVLSNQYIQDQATTPNILEPTVYNFATETSTGTAWYGNFQRPAVLKASVSITPGIANLYSDWDTTPPDFAALRTYTDNWNDPLSAYELNPLASPGGLVNRIEMHFYDNRIDYSNPSETWKWQSRTGWYETTTATIEHPAPENFGGARPDRQLTGPFPTQPTSGGIRDSSFHNASTAFVIDNSGPTATGLDITNFTTGVNSPFYNILATLNMDDDPYITLHLDDLALGWPIATASIQVTYTNWIDDNLNGGFVTDLAGNLLGSQTNMQTLDRTPPEVTVSIAGANRDELYLVFSKEIGTGTTVWDGIELHLENPAAVLIPTTVETRPGTGQVLFFRLPVPITPNQLVNPASEIRFIAHGPLVPNPETGVPEAVTAYSDTMGNYVSLAETHRITDIAVGLVEVLYASDGVNTDGIFGSNEGALRVFDGTGRLLDRNLTIATHLSNETAAPLALTMYYDAAAPAASLPGLFNSATGFTSRLWLPGVQPGFNTQGNPAARALGADQILDADRLFRNFAISEADEDMVPGSDIDILFRYGDLYCARLEDPADISSVAPWTIGIAETKRQRGGVTILNNVIDSRRRERTIVQVEVPEAGNIVIQVFTLDGNTVKVLERGRKGAGTYQYFWDGTNNGGRPVARGMYFIRVVGPDIDEIRKVMVVKE